MMLAFCWKCYFRSYLALKLFIPYVILKKLRFQYFISSACYNETKYIIDYVSVIPIDDLSNICLNISVSQTQVQITTESQMRTTRTVYFYFLCKICKFWCAALSHMLSYSIIEYEYGVYNFMDSWKKTTVYF